jgi:hypothetical protein
MNKEEPVFSVLTGKSAGFNATCEDASWRGACGDYCPVGNFDGVPYYTNSYPFVMFRENGYWYVALGDTPGTSNFGGAPQSFIQSNSSTPPLTGWSDGGVLTQTTCA